MQIDLQKVSIFLKGEYSVKHITQYFPIHRQTIYDIRNRSKKIETIRTYSLIEIDREIKKGEKSDTFKSIALLHLINEYQSNQTEQNIIRLVREAKIIRDRHHQLIVWGIDNGFSLLTGTKITNYPENSVFVSKLIEK